MTHFEAKADTVGDGLYVGREDWALVFLLKQYMKGGGIYWDVEHWGRRSLQESSVSFYVGFRCCLDFLVEMLKRQLGIWEGNSEKLGNCQHVNGI